MSDWFQIKEVKEGAFCIEEPGHVQSYLINGDTHSALIDTGMGFCDIRTAIEPLMQEQVIVLNTHWHFDHIGGNPLFEGIGIARNEGHLIARNIPNAVLMDLYLNPCLLEGVPLPAHFNPDAYAIQGSKPSFFISEGDHFDLGDRALEAIATPGHTRGSMSFLDIQTGSLFSGDFIYPGSIYAHFNDSDTEQYVESLDKIWHHHQTFDSIFGAHNEYPVPRSYIRDVREGFDKINNKTISPITIGDWGEPVHCYQWGEINILTKIPGSKGIRLFG